MKKKNLLAALLVGCLMSISMVHAGVPHDEEGNFKSSDFFASMQTGDKAAVLMVHFGTTYDETRALTIDAINEKAREAFEGTEVREAYTSLCAALKHAASKS